MTPPTEPRELNASTIRETAIGFQASRVLLTAVELDVFTAIGEGSTTSDEVALAIGARPRSTDRLLNALCALGFLTKAAGRFTNTKEARRFLVRGSPGFMAGLGHTASMWKAWSGMTEAVRTDRPALRQTVNERGDQWLEPFIAAMHYRAEQQADRLVRAFDLTRVERVLDVGGGSGSFAMAFCRRRPGLSAVVFDLPNVVPLTRRYVAEAGLSDRVTAVVGDYLEVENLPGGFDLIFLSAVIHSNGPAENEALIAKCAWALNPGGRVAVVDFIMDDDRLSPPVGAMFALNMLVATDEGDTYTESEVRGWMESAGLSGISRTDTAFGTAIIQGRR
ncbi:MAG: methyltransferase [Acidobacteriota bacterium]